MSTSTSNVYRTAPADAELHPSGWARVDTPAGPVEVTRLPMVDRSTGLFARLSYADLLTVAEREGARLPTMATLKAVWESGLRLDPVTLPPTAEMASRAWAERHDAAVHEQLRRAGWDGTRPVANVGKVWIADASPGKARNGGWFRANGTPIQPGGAGSEHHDRHHVDYSQLAHLERDVRVSDAPDTDPSPTLGARLVAWYEAELAKGVREEPLGSNTSPRIREYLTRCRRDPDGPGPKGETELGLTTANWCAAMYCFGAHEVARGGEAYPAPRCSGIEMVADAKATGTWLPIEDVRAGGEQPEPGDAAIYRREGSGGWERHVACVTRAPGADGRFETIGGNEEHRMRRTPRSVRDTHLVGFVVLRRRG